MQEALVQTFRFISRLRDPEAFRPWLYRMVRNACLMSRRRRVGRTATSAAARRSPQRRHPFPLTLRPGFTPHGDRAA
jgi:DNA-directed RNA polymerase specialized sigma24 family protein